MLKNTKLRWGYTHCFWIYGSAHLCYHSAHALLTSPNYTSLCYYGYRLSQANMHSMKIMTGGMEGRQKKEWCFTSKYTEKVYNHLQNWTVIKG